VIASRSPLIRLCGLSQGLFRIDGNEAVNTRIHSLNALQMLLGQFHT
jgi:hypothetical protein